tara:strand:+ start:651 stop:806 length:156 start_codon:yes stop_codon:yes gene_type:complete
MKYEYIANWIYNKCENPIEEIKFLLENNYKTTDELEEQYSSIFRFYDKNKG